MVYRTLIVTALPVLAVIGCTRDHKPTAYGGGPGLQANIDDGIARVASAKCDRETRCGNIGAGRSYDSRAQCETVHRGKLTDDIRLKDCRGGINEGELQECIREVRTESCTNPFEKFATHAECRVSELCFN